MEHRFSCSEACGVFPDKGSNPWPLHWQADSQALDHQGSPCASKEMEALTGSSEHGVESPGPDRKLRSAPVRFLGQLA